MPPQVFHRGLGRAFLARVIAAIGLTMAGPAMACQLCLEQPEFTLTDRIWDADTVALARPDPANPFVYEVTEVLKGEAVVPVPFLVDSPSRRVFANDPAWAALLLKYADDEWELAAQGGAALKTFAARASTSETKWTDQQDDPDRFAAFAALHAHTDPVLRRLALTELSRMPYAQIRQVEVTLPAAWLAKAIADPDWYDWQPILVLLMGRHRDTTAQELIRRNALSVWPPDRAPWLVALVEIDGTAAIDRIFALPPQGEEAQAAILALDTLARADAVPSEDLGRALTRLAIENPDQTARVLPALMALGDRSFVSEAARLLDSGAVTAPAEVYLFDAYLAGRVESE